MLVDKFVQFSWSEIGKYVFLGGGHLKCQIQRPHWESALAPGIFELSRTETISVQNFMLVDKFAQFSWPGIGKSVFLGGGHFEMPNTATPLRIGFGSR